MVANRTWISGRGAVVRDIEHCRQRKGNMVKRKGRTTPVHSGSLGQMGGQSLWVGETLITS